MPELVGDARSSRGQPDHADRPGLQSVAGLFNPRDAEHQWRSAERPQNIRYGFGEFVENALAHRLGFRYEGAVVAGGLDPTEVPLRLYR